VELCHDIALAYSSSAELGRRRLARLRINSWACYPVGAFGAFPGENQLVSCSHFGELQIKRERERDLLQVPHFFVGTLQPL